MAEITLRETIALGYASRTTIMRKIANKSLHPTRRQDNRLYFDTDELDAVFENKCLPEDGIVELVRRVCEITPRLSRPQALDLIKYIYETCVREYDVQPDSDKDKEEADAIETEEPPAPQGKCDLEGDDTENI